VRLGARTRKGLTLAAQGVHLQRDRIYAPYGALSLVVLGVDPQDMFEMSAAHDQEPVETLVADGADESLRVGVCLRRLHRRVDDRDSFAAEELVEGGGELAVAIVDQGNASAREGC
jgi:hypothetical protein